jgi:hypothetical protein
MKSEPSSESHPKKPEVEALCKKVLCRQPAPIRLRLKDGKAFETLFPQAMPIISGGLVTIMAGETVLIEATLKGGVLVDLVAVPKLIHPERTLVFKLTQEAGLADGLGMVLKVISPFSGSLKYRLGMMLPSSDRLLKTSSCPVDTGKPVYESWPHPVFQLVATDFRILDATSPGAGRWE